MKKGSIAPKDFMKILNQQNFRCAYTGVRLVPEDASADHRIPVSLGGEHSAENITIVTRKINAMKGTLPLDEFVNLCGMVYEHMGRPQIEREEKESFDSQEDPVEILARLGYAAAANKVLEIKIRNENLQKSTGRNNSVKDLSQETINNRAEKLAELNREIQSLQIRRSHLRAQIPEELKQTA